MTKGQAWVSLSYENGTKRSIAPIGWPGAGGCFGSTCQSGAMLNMNVVWSLSLAAPSQQLTSVFLSSLPKPSFPFVFSLSMSPLSISLLHQRSLVSCSSSLSATRHCLVLSLRCTALSIPSDQPFCHDHVHGSTLQWYDELMFNLNNNIIWKANLRIWYDEVHGMTKYYLRCIRYDEILHLIHCWIWIYGIWTNIHNNKIVSCRLTS